jgi:hypothetical protein
MIARQLAKAPSLWLPTRRGEHELITLLSVPENIDQDQTKALEFMARGLIAAAYGVAVPATLNFRVLPVNFLKYDRVFDYLGSGRFPIDPLLTGSIGDGIVEWIGAGIVDQTLNRVHALICLEFYRRSLYFVSVTPELEQTG